MSDRRNATEASRTQRLGGDQCPLTGGEVITLDYYAVISGDRDGLALLARLSGQSEASVLRMDRTELVQWVSVADRLYHAEHQRRIVAANAAKV